MVDQRFATAVESVSRLRAEDPEATPDQLADRLIRRTSKEMAVGGAMTGGAAASPVAGVAVAAASAGADATYSVGKLSEMIMGLGIIYGHEHATVEERATWIWAVLGISEGAAVGLTGLAARAGSRGGARLLARLPAGSQAAVNTKLSQRVMARLSTGKGPWSLAALIPYGIGAGVGAAGNAVLAQSVGRAAKQYFSGDLGRSSLPTHEPVVEDAGEDTEVLDGDDPSAGPDGGPTAGVRADDEILDAEIVDERPPGATG